MVAIIGAPEGLVKKLLAAQTDFFAKPAMPVRTRCSFAHKCACVFPKSCRGRSAPVHRFP